MSFFNRIQSISLIGIFFVVHSSVIAAPKKKANEEISAQRTKEIKDFLKAARTEEMAQQMLEQMIATMKVQMQGADAEFWADFKKEAQPEKMLDKLVPIYAKHLTSQQVRGLTQFFKSSLGQSYLNSLPKIQKDSFEVGREWGEQVAERAVERYQKRVPKEKGKLPPQVERSGQPKN